jgi:transposase
MKEWIVIHQIKSLYNDGTGLSVHKIAKQLNISRNTVSKYLTMSAEQIAALKADTDRPKKLDEYRDYIVQLLQTYPGLSAVKVLRKLKAKVGLINQKNGLSRNTLQSFVISGLQPKYRFQIRQ